MKVVYVKSNSERAKKFQLRTIVYEIDGQKYVKKQAICKEAIPHLKKMKRSYHNLKSSIINENIKLAEIIDESEDSLTFEFIDGVSLESKFNSAIKLGDDEVLNLVDEYINLLATGFKTTIFDSSKMLNEDYKEIFGDIDYGEFDGELCYDSVSNLDLISSNIIYKDENIYIIDYEWIYDISVPLNLLNFRSIENMQFSESIFKKIVSYKKYDLNWKLITSNFIEMVVVSAYYKYSHRYNKNRVTLEQQNSRVNHQTLEINNQILEINNKNLQIHNLHVEVGNWKKRYNSMLLVKIKNIIRKKFKTFLNNKTK